MDTLSSAPAIKLRGLVKRFAELVAVAGIDLDVQAGTCFGLLGPNGAGKTTTLEMIEGITPPTSGEIRVLGLDWRHHEVELRQRIGITLQDAHFQDRLTVRETLQLFGSFYRRPASVDSLLALVGLQEKRGAWVMNLSGGQRQRLALACALVGEPELLFLDEPTTGLDPQSRRAIWDIVAELRARGRTVVLTTHNMEEATFLCDRVAIIDHGRVIADGTPGELIRQHGGDRRVELLPSALLDPAALADIEGVLSLTPQGETLQVGVRALHETLPLLIERLRALAIPIARLSTHEPTLEDVFVSLTGRKLRDEA